MKKTLLCLFLALLGLCLSACSVMTEGVLTAVADKAAETGADQLTRQFIDGLFADDLPLSHAAMVQEVTLPMMQEAFAPMRGLLPEEADSYALTPTHWSMKTDNGRTSHTFQFLLTAAERQYIVEAQLLQGHPGLYNIHLQEIDPDAAPQPAASQGSSVLWDVLSLLLTVATFALLIWALVDCLKRNLRRRWLWLLLILFGSVLLSIVAANTRLNFGFRLGLFLSMSRIALSAGSFGAKVIVPVGAIVYLSLRHRITQPDAHSGFMEAFAPAEAAPTDEPGGNEDESEEV